MQEEMRIIAYIILAVIVGIIVLFTFLNWLTARTYKPTPTDDKQEMQNIG